MLQLPCEPCKLHGQPYRPFNARSAVLKTNQRYRRSGRSNIPCLGADAEGVTVDQSEVGASWDQLMRWSRIFRTRRNGNGRGELERINKVSVLGGGSFGTAMGTALARQREDLEVVMLLRDENLVQDINNHQDNTKYLKVRNLCNGNHN